MRLATAQAWAWSATWISAPRPSGGADDLGALHGRQQASDAVRDAVGERRVRTDQDRLGVFVVFGLGEQVHGDQSGSVWPSQTTRISEGPAIMSMPTWPNT